MHESLQGYLQSINNHWYLCLNNAYWTQTVQEGDAGPESRFLYLHHVGVAAAGPPVGHQVYLL